jgi:flagellar motor switch protein FliN/FliY
MDAPPPTSPKPDNTPAQPGSTPSAAQPKPADAGAAAAEAISAAERAVASLQSETGVQAAQEAIAQAKATNGDAAAPFPLPAFAPQGAGKKAEGIDLLADVNLQVKIELGRTRMLVEDVLRLGEGSVVELDKLAGDPVDVYVNDRHVARGEVLVLNDNFCVRVNEIVAQVGVAGER